MPLEARMYGMFAGFVTTWAYLIWRGRGKNAQTAPTWMLAAFVGFIAVMGFDGVNATLYDFNYLSGQPIPFLYLPRNDLRLLTGFLSGIGMAGLAIPVMNYMLWRKPSSEALIVQKRDFIGLLLIQFILIVLILSGSGLFLYPLSLIGVIGVIATLSCLNSVIVLSFFPRLRADNWRGALTALVVAMLLTALQLGILSALRYAVLGTETLP